MSVDLRTLHFDVHLDAISEYLKTDLQRYVDAVNATVIDGLLAPSVPASNVFDGGQWPIPTLTPEDAAIEVAIPDFSLERLDVANTDADEELRIVMRAWVQHVGDASTAVRDVYRKATRLGRAILAATVPQANDAWGNEAVVTRVRGMYRANPETDQREAWTSSVVLEFTVEDVDLF